MTDLERVARAMWEVQGPTSDGSTLGTWERANPISRDNMLLQARAALTELRELSQLMFMTMERYGVSFQTQQRMWPALIDAILSAPQL